MDACDLLSVCRDCVFEGVPGDSLALLGGDDLDALDNSGDDLVFDLGVLSLRALSDCDNVDVLVPRVESWDTESVDSVGEQVQFLGHMVGLAGVSVGVVSDGSLEDGSVLSQLLDAVVVLNEVVEPVESDWDRELVEDSLHNLCQRGPEPSPGTTQ